MTLYIAAAICAAGFSQGDGAAGLYAPLLRKNYHGRPASQMVVKDTAVAMPTVRGSSRDWLKGFDEVPSELQRAASQPSPTASHRLDASLFPTGTRLVSAAAVKATLKGSGLDGGWPAFRRHFSALGWLAFSDGLLADDQLNALVYYETHCGGLCGEGGYVWLRRDTGSAPWRIAEHCQLDVLTDASASCQPLQTGKQQDVALDKRP
jgi:hypothetical protein